MSSSTFPHKNLIIFFLNHANDGLSRSEVTATNLFTFVSFIASIITFALSEYNVVFPSPSGPIVEMIPSTPSKAFLSVSGSVAVPSNHSTWPSSNLGAFEIFLVMERTW